jgi:hypothetical protein
MGNMGMANSEWAEKLERMDHATSPDATPAEAAIETLRHYGKARIAAALRDGRPAIPREEVEQAEALAALEAEIRTLGERCKAAETVAQANPRGRTIEDQRLRAERAEEEVERLRGLLRESYGWMNGAEPKPAEPFLEEVRLASDEGGE